MKLLLKRLALLTIVFGLTIAFIGCNETSTTTEEQTTGTTTENVTTTTEEPTTTVDLLATVPNRIIIDGSDQITGNFLLPGEVLGVTITYASSNTDVATISETVNDDGFYTVYITTPSIPLGGENTSVVITGTMTYGGETETFTKTIRVIAQNIIFVNNIAEVHANASLNDVVEVTGTVFSIFSGGFFIYDETGTLGVYDSSVDVAVGDNITLKGTYANYYTLYQLASIADYTINSSGNAITLQPIVLGNGAYIANADSTDKTLAGTLFTVTALLEERTNTSGYTNMYLVDVDGNAIAQIYHYSDSDSLDVLKALIDEVITLDVVYYTDHGDVVYVSFYGTSADVTVADTDEKVAAFYADALEIEDSYVNNTSSDLPTSIGVATVSWAPGASETNITVSGNTATFADVTGDTTAVLTATVTYTPDGGSAVVLTRDFTVTILDQTEAQLVATDKADLDITLTATEMDKVALPTDGGMGSTITWAVTSGAAYLSGTSVVYDFTGAAANVVLTATITNGAASDTKDFTVAVSPITVSTIADALAGTNGDYFAVRGVVYYTTVNGFFLQDGSNKLLVYTSSTPTVAVGDEVVIYGARAEYHGSKQIQYPIVSSAITTGNDATQTSEGAFDPATTTLQTGYTYTVTGTVQYGAVVTGGYDNLFFGTGTDAGTAMVYYKADAASYALLKSLVGQNITVDLVYYNEDAVSMFVFLGTSDDITINGITDAELITAALNSIDLPNTVTENTTLTLPTSAFGVAFTYSSDMASYITDAGVVTVTDGMQVTVTLTVTGTFNSLTDTLAIEIQVGELPVSDIADIYDATKFEEGDMIKIQGILTADTKTSAFWLQDTTSGINLYVPSALRTEFAALTIGSELLIVGEVDIYNGLYEVANFTYEVISDTPALPASTDISDVDFTPEALLAYQGQLVTLNGYTLQSVIADPGTSDFTFTLVSVVDDSKTMYVYVDSDASGFAALATELQTYSVDDVLIIEGGILGWYNSPQLLLSYDSQVRLATDAELLALEVAMFDPTAMFEQGTTIEVPLAGELGTTFTWDVTEITNAGGTFDALTGELTFPTLTATTTYSGTVTITIGTESQVVNVSVEVFVLTDAEKLAADKAELDIALTAIEFDTVTLPDTLTYGSVVTWALDSGTATLNGNDLTFDYVGADQTVVVTATLTYTKADTTTITDTKSFTITVTAAEVITDLSLLTSIADGEVVILQGVVAGFVSSGFFLEDASGNGIYLYKGEGYNDGTVVVGDQVIYEGTLGTYYGVRQLATGAALLHLIDQGNTPVVTPYTENALALATNADTNFLISNAAFEISNIVSGSYIEFTAVSDDTLTTTLFRYYYTSANPWLADVYSVGDTVDLQFVLITYYSSGYWKIDVVTTEMTDAQAQEADAAQLPSTLTMSEDEVLPTPLYGSTFTVVGVTGDAATYIDYTTTPGTLILTSQPSGADATGTVTVQVSIGTELDITVDIAVTVSQAMTLLYSTGFETAEGFTASTSYSSGFTANNWIGVSGVVTATNGTTEDLHLQMRDYADSIIPYAQWSDGSTVITVVVFNAFTNTAGTQLTVQFSLDGTTWSTGTVVDLATTDGTFTVNSDLANSIYVRFSETTATESSQRVSLDDVKIY